MLKFHDAVKFDSMKMLRFFRSFPNANNHQEQISIHEQSSQFFIDAKG